MVQAFTTILADSELTIANLETPTTDRFPSPYAGVKKYLHYADTKETPRHLASHGFNLVSLANNHILDFGVMGLEQTLALLRSHQIDTCGAGLDENTAQRPYVERLTVGDRELHIAVLCMFEYRKEYDENYAWYANTDKPGVNALSVEQVRLTVKGLREKYKPLLIIAFPHWGKNYRWATDSQRMQARGMIDAGVDLVMGHGAHQLQDLERYKGRWIVYGLGNFVFGSPGRYAKNGARPYGLIARLRVTPGGDAPVVALKLYPIFTDNRITGYQSRFVTETEFGQVQTLLDERFIPENQFTALTEMGKDKHGFFIDLSMD